MPLTCDFSPVGMERNSRNPLHSTSMEISLTNWMPNAQVVTPILSSVVGKISRSSPTARSIDQRLELLPTLWNCVQSGPDYWSNTWDKAKIIEAVVWPAIYTQKWGSKCVFPGVSHVCGMPEVNEPSLAIGTLYRGNDDRNNACGAY